MSVTGLDNDVAPAARLGLQTALINRGPGVMIWRYDPAASQVPTLRVDSPGHLPAVLVVLRSQSCLRLERRTPPLSGLSLT